MIGRILAGRYKLVSIIGNGGMSIVYKAIDLRTGHDVAIKVLRPEFKQDAEFLERFDREALAASKMSHHNIVNLLDVGEDKDNRFIVMEYVEGKTLKQVIKEKGRLSPQVTTQIAIRILSALQHAHKNGIIHRDIKPQNVLVHSEGLIKVSDFGIARMADTKTISKADSVMGSVHYFSPEQAKGEPVTERSDLYSVGVVMYEMLTGHVPFDGETPVAVAMQHIRNKPAPITTFSPDVPPALCRVVMKAMEKNPAERYQSARDMAEDLLQSQKSQGAGDSKQTTGNQRILSARDAGRSAKNLKRGRTRKQTKVVSALLTIALLIFVIVSIYAGITAVHDSVVNTVTVPDLVDLTEAEAIKLNKDKGLNTSIMRQHHEAVREGYVISQTPAMETSAKKGDTVYIIVSLGADRGKVPAFVDMNIEHAITIASASGIILQMVEQKVVSDQPNGTILSQTPEAGTAISAGEAVTVTVSGGKVTIPELRGKTIAEAVEQLDSSNLRVSDAVLSVSTADEKLAGLVSAQSIAAGETVIEETEITLTVYEYVSVRYEGTITITLPSYNRKLEVVIKAVDESENETEIFRQSYESRDSRSQDVVIKGPEKGSYPYSVYIDSEFYSGGVVVLH